MITFSFLKNKVFGIPLSIWYILGLSFILWGLVNGGW